MSQSADFDNTIISKPFAPACVVTAKAHCCECDEELARKGTKAVVDMTRMIVYCEACAEAES